jgi:hypothetical protein
MAARMDMAGAKIVMDRADFHILLRRTIRRGSTACATRAKSRRYRRGPGGDFSYAPLGYRAVYDRGLPALSERGYLGIEDRGLPAVTVLGYSDPALQSALERLVGADLLFVAGAGAQATYRFSRSLDRSDLRRTPTFSP